jgi:polygalacturonase
MRVGRPTERVAIRGCVMRSGHGGVVIGSETAGGVRDVLVERCEFHGTDRGLRIKTRRGRGGTVENIALRDCLMTDVLCPLVMNCYYAPGGPPADAPEYSLDPRPIDATTPKIRGVTVERLRAEGCRAAAGFVVGLPESPVEELAIIDSHFSIAAANLVPVGEAAMSRGLPDAAGRGIRLRNVRGARIEGVRVEPSSVRAWERD